jgi:hypothetical protein
MSGTNVTSLSRRTNDVTSGDLLEKLTGQTLVNNSPEFYGTNKVIAVFTTAGPCPYSVQDKSSQRHSFLFQWNLL